MAKGGKRVPSDTMPVGKGMGLSQHYETLKTIQKMDNVNVRSIMIELNKKYAWWDDPKDKAPIETCRSYIKELWRLGLLDKFTRDDKIIELNENSWRCGGSKTYVKISKRGKFIMDQKEKLFPYYIAWCILDAVKNNIYPQCSKIFKLYDKTAKIPVSDPETAKETKNLGIYVEKHAGKTIKFGWLEPTGLIYRSSRGYFKVNQQFKNFIGKQKLHEMFNEIQTQVDNEHITTVLNEPYFGYQHFNRDSKITFSFEFKNKTNNSILVNLEYSLSSVFQHVTDSKISTKKFRLMPNKPKTVTITLISKNHGFSDSFGIIFCGILKIITEYGTWQLYCPSLIIAKKDRVWEHFVLSKLEKLGLKTFHFGKSDRPDGVVDLSGLNENPPDLLEYLRDNKKEKMLMETAVGKYTWMKRIQDTQTTSIRKDKYSRHTAKVLKIKAIGQLVTASKFDDNDFLIIEDERDHIITLIDMEVLDYLIKKKQESDNGRDAIIKVLKLDKMVEKTDVNSVFEESE